MGFMGGCAYKSLLVEHVSCFWGLARVSHVGGVEGVAHRYVYMCIHVYVYTCICVYMYTCMCKCVLFFPYVHQAWSSNTP
jgi:hypothetical protein